MGMWQSFMFSTQVESLIAHAESVGWDGWLPTVVHGVVADGWQAAGSSDVYDDLPGEVMASWNPEPGAAALTIDVWDSDCSSIVVFPSAEPRLRCYISLEGLVCAVDEEPTEAELDDPSLDALGLYEAGAARRRAKLNESGRSGYEAGEYLRDWATRVGLVSEPFEAVVDAVSAENTFAEDSVGPLLEALGLVRFGSEDGFGAKGS